MIRAAIRDGGTLAQLQPNVVPGMDRLTWIEADYDEGSLISDKQAEGNAAMKDVTPQVVTPWPFAWPNHMPVDLTDRYVGLTFRLDAYDQHLEDYSTVPDGAITLQEEATIDHLDRADSSIGAALDQAEIRSWVDDPTEWLHYNHGNGPGYTSLEDPLVLGWRGLSGPAFRLALEDNFLFTPFDLGEIDRYSVFDSVGIRRSHHQLSLAPAGDYVLHLRPRRWVVFAMCLARYIWVTPFELAYNDEIFIVTSHTRPPVYPMRHDVLRTRTYTVGNDFWGVPVSYDLAIDHSFRASEAAAVLRAEIWKQQWIGLSSAYLLVEVWPATLYIDSEIPQTGEIVCGISGRTVGADDPPVWVRQDAYLGAEYPREDIGTFSSDFFGEI